MPAHRLMGGNIDPSFVAGQGEHQGYIFLWWCGLDLLFALNLAVDFLDDLICHVLRQGLPVAGLLPLRLPLTIEGLCDDGSRLVLSLDESFAKFLQAVSIHDDGVQVKGLEVLLVNGHLVL